jgi:hypothetical protein
MNMSKRIFKAAITLSVMSAMLISWLLWPSVQDASPKSKAAAALPPITIWFGRKSKGCRGFGICGITIGKLAANQRGVKAELSATRDGKLQLTLLGKPPEEGQTLFIDEDIPLSQEIAKSLGLKSATVQRGEYAYSANKSVLSARLTR